MNKRLNTDTVILFVCFCTIQAFIRPGMKLNTSQKGLTEGKTHQCRSFNDMKSCTRHIVFFSGAYYSLCAVDSKRAIKRMLL